MSVKLSRRALIGGGLVVTGAAAFGGYRLAGPHLDKESAIAGYIARQMPGLEANDEAVRAFARDAVATPLGPPLEEHFDVHVVLLANPALKRFLSASQASGQLLFERVISYRFLMSTNYLKRPAPPAKITYLGWSDPYRSGCSNPVADLT